MKKSIIKILVIVVLVAFFSGCSNTSNIRDWNLMLSSAKGKVTIAIETENDRYIQWLERTFAGRMLDMGVELEIVRIPNAKVIDRLEEEKENLVKEGSYDIIILENGGFKELKSKDLIYGPFVDQLPNVGYIDFKDYSFKYREAYPVNGYALPIGRRMLTILSSEDIFYSSPSTYEDIFETLPNVKGRTIYPNPRTSKAGEAFILGYIGTKIDMEKYLKPDRDLDMFKMEVANAMLPLLDIRKELMNAGLFYPSNTEQLFMQKRSLMYMSMDPILVSERIKAYEYPETTMTFAVQNVGTYNTFAVIPFNSVNKSGAAVTLAELISPKMQASKMTSGDMTIYKKDAGPEAFEPFKQLKLHKSVLKYSDLINCVSPEFDHELIEIVIKVWGELIPSKALIE